jgi:Xaa-Pro aminopeptidase
MMLDTGLIWDGYFCDFDRNYSIGAPTAQVAERHSQLIEAVQAGFENVKPGGVISDVFHAMNAVINPSGQVMEAGRLGHGLGMQLTEWPSIIADDHTPLVAGMVLTLEPSVTLDGDMIMVAEEDILITKGGAEYLSAPQSKEIRVI